MPRTFQFHLEELSDRVVPSVVLAEEPVHTGEVESVHGLPVTPADASGDGTAWSEGIPTGTAVATAASLWLEESAEGQDGWVGYVPALPVVATTVPIHHGGDGKEKVSSLAICETGDKTTGKTCQHDNLIKHDNVTFLPQGMINLNQPTFTGQPWPQSLPTSPVRGKPGQIQDWYNRKVMEIGEATGKKVTNLVVKQVIMWEMNNQPNGAKPPASGTFIHPSGQTFVVALGRDDEVAKDQKKWEMLFKQIGWVDIKLNATDVEITYAVDGATQNPRSGNIVATYKVRLHFTGIYNGQPIARIRDSVMGTILIHDAKVETMDIQP